MNSCNGNSSVFVGCKNRPKTVPYLLTAPTCFHRWSCSIRAADGQAFSFTIRSHGWVVQPIPVRLKCNPAPLYISQSEVRRCLMSGVSEQTLSHVKHLSNITSSLLEKRLDILTERVSLCTRKGGLSL